MWTSIVGAWIVSVGFFAGGALAVPPGGPSSPTAIQSNLASERELEEGVIAQLHATNGREIALGELALKQASDPLVRVLADRLVRDHEFADRLLRNLAHDRGLTLAGLAHEITGSDDGADLVKLRAEHGTAFDRAFLDSMIEGDEAAIGMLTGAWDTVAQPPLRALVRRLIPLFEQHVELARNLAVARPTS